MKNTLTLFLLCVFLCSFLFFGAIIFLNYTFLDIFRLPVPTLLFVAGGLVPGIVGYILYSKTESPNLFKIRHANSIILLLVYMLVHVSLYNLFGVMKPASNLIRLIVSIPLATLIFGIQEIGWIKLVQENYETKKGYIRSIIIMGLLKSLTFLPLLFLRGFPANMNFMSFFAAMIVGISALSVSVYRNSEALVTPVLLVGVLYAIMASVYLNQSLTMVLIAFLECSMVFYLQDFLYKKTI